EQNCFVVTVIQGLSVGKNGVGVGAGYFRPGHRDVDVLPSIGRDLDPDTCTQGFLTEVGSPRPSSDGDVDLCSFGRDAHFLRAVEYQRPYVAGFEFISAHSFTL